MVIIIAYKGLITQLLTFASVASYVHFKVFTEFYERTLKHRLREARYALSDNFPPSFTRGIPGPEDEGLDDEIIKAMVADLNSVLPPDQQVEVRNNFTYLGTMFFFNKTPKEKLLILNEKEWFNAPPKSLFLENRAII